MPIFGFIPTAAERLQSSTLGDLVRGTGPSPAQRQLARGFNQIRGAAAGMAGADRSNPALALRNAMLAADKAGSQYNMQQAELRSREQLGALGMQGQDSAMRTAGLNAVLGNVAGGIAGAAGLSALGAGEPKPVVKPEQAALSQAFVDPNKGPNNFAANAQSGMAGAFGQAGASMPAQAPAALGMQLAEPAMAVPAAQPPSGQPASPTYAAPNLTPQFSVENVARQAASGIGQQTQASQNALVQQGTAAGTTVQNAPEAPSAGEQILSTLGNVAKVALPFISGSDERMKSNIGPGSGPMQQFLDNIQPKSFSYTAPEDAAAYGQGQQVGVMAQALGKTPVGQQMLVQDPGGRLAIDPAKAVGPNLAAMAHLNERLNRIEAEIKPRGDAPKPLDPQQRKGDAIRAALGAQGMKEKPGKAVAAPTRRSGASSRRGATSTPASAQNASVSRLAPPMDGPMSMPDGRNMSEQPTSREWDLLDVLGLGETADQMFSGQNPVSRFLRGTR